MNGKHGGAQEVTNMNRIMARKANELYRNSPKAISSDSEAESHRNSTSNDSDYQFSMQDLQENDSGTVHDITSENDLGSHSILAGKSPADRYYSYTYFIPESRYSTISARRLESIDPPDKESLLNMATNESVAANGDNRSYVIETSCYMLKSKGRGRPSIISNETADFSIKKFEQPVIKASASQEFISHNSILQDRNNNIECSSSSSGLNDNEFQSLLSESGQLVIADVKTLNMKAISFIEDCYKSSPKVGVNADTFGSEFITDISNLSALRDGSNSKTDHNRDKIFSKLTQSFAAGTTKFAEMLLALFEESTQVSSKPENPAISEVSLNRFLEEFRKICNGYGKVIENDSVPDFGFGLSFDASVTFDEHSSRGETAAGDETATSSLQNFDLPDSSITNINLDSTEMFEFWENLCHEMSPTKRPMCSGLLTREDLMRKSDQLMASLEESIRETDREGIYDSCEKNVSITPKDCRVRSNLTRQTSMETSSSLLANRNDKSNEVLADPNNKQNYNEIQEILTTRIAEKTLSCFETARQASEPEQSATRNAYSKSLDQIPECLEENESLSECDDEVTFLSTLSACMDHSDHVNTLQKHRNSLHCILECSEDSESAKESIENSMSTKYVEVLIFPVQNRAKYKLEIAQTSLYLPGSPKISNAQSLATSPRRTNRCSPSRSVSPGLMDSRKVEGKKYFFTPGKTPAYGKVRPKKKYLQTPRARTPNTKSKVASPIFAGSPGLSPISTETYRWNFRLTPARRQREENLNIAPGKDV